MRRLFFLAAVLSLSPLLHAADVFVRFRVVNPPGQSFHATVSGWRHEDPWYLPTATADVEGGAWSNWLDLSKWPWHGKLDRAGGIAEWPSVRITVANPKVANP